MRRAAPLAGQWAVRSAAQGRRPASGKPTPIRWYFSLRPVRRSGVVRPGRGGAERGPPLFLSRWFHSESFRCRRIALLLVSVSAPGRLGVFSLP